MRCYIFLTYKSAVKWSKPPPTASYTTLAFFPSNALSRNLYTLLSPSLMQIELKAPSSRINADESSVSQIAKTFALNTLLASWMAARPLPPGPAITITMSFSFNSQYFVNASSAEPYPCRRTAAFRSDTDPTSKHSSSLTTHSSAKPPPKCLCADGIKVKNQWIAIYRLDGYICMFTRFVPSKEAILSPGLKSCLQLSPISRISPENSLPGIIGNMISSFFCSMYCTSTKFKLQ